MTKVQIDINSLKVLAQRSKRSGNTRAMLDIAMEFAETANKRIEDLQAEIRALKMYLNN